MKFSGEAGMSGYGILIDTTLCIGCYTCEAADAARRATTNGLFISALLVVIGFVLNRLNIAITAIESSSGTSYFPAWTEISITLMIVALGFAIFRLSVRYLPIFPEHHNEEMKTAAHDIVTFLPVNSINRVGVLEYSKEY